MSNYYESAMAAIPESTNSASTSSALSSWLEKNEEWGFTATQLTAICRKICTTNSAVLSSIVSDLTGFRTKCGACNASAAIALMCLEGLHSNIATVENCEGLYIVVAKYFQLLMLQHPR